MAALRAALTGECCRELSRGDMDVFPKLHAVLPQMRFLSTHSKTRSGLPETASCRLPRNSRVRNAWR